MATKTEVIERAATDLGILRLGQSLQSQDDARIEAGYNEVYQGLEEQGLAIWTTTGEVPTNLVPYVVALVANNCAPSYSVSDKRFQRISFSNINALREIKRIVAPEYESVEPVTDY